MKEFVGRVKRLSNDTWVVIIVAILSAAAGWGSTKSQIGELQRSQDRTEAAQLRLELKVDGIVNEQAVVKAALSASEAKLQDHIDETQRHFMEMGNARSKQGRAASGWPRDQE